MDRLVSIYHQPLYRYLCRMLRNTEDAKDVLQNTWIQIYTHIGELQKQSSERAYIYKVATNCAYMWLRDERQLDSIEEVNPSLVQSFSAVPDLPPVQILVIHLERTVLRLPPVQRAIFNLRYHEDMPYDEIAQVTGSTIDAAKTNYSLAKAKISRWITAIMASLLLALTLGIGWETMSAPVVNQPTELVYSSEDWTDFAEDDLFLE